MGTHACSPRAHMGSSPRDYISNVRHSVLVLLEAGEEPDWALRYGGSCGLVHDMVLGSTRGWLRLGSAHLTASQGQLRHPQYVQRLTNLAANLASRKMPGHIEAPMLRRQGFDSMRCCCRECFRSTCLGQVLSGDRSSAWHYWRELLKALA